MTMPVRPKKPNKRLRDRTLTDMQAFYLSVDWREWWEDFYLALDPNGMRRYRSAKLFAHSKAKNLAQLKFLCWYLGPPEPGAKPAYLFCGLEPQDWDEKRNTGGWYSDKALKTLAQQVAKKMNALEAMREVGDTYTLRSVIRAEKMAQQIDEAFQGRMFVESNTLTDNIARAKVYIDLQSQILEHKQAAQRMYIESHGINLNNMEGFAQLIASVALAKQSTESRLTAEESAIRQIVQMTMIKAARHGLALPKDFQERIVDVVAEHEQGEKKKSNLQ